MVEAADEVFQVFQGPSSSGIFGSLRWTVRGDPGLRASLTWLVQVGGVWLLPHGGVDTPGWLCPRPKWWGRKSTLSRTHIPMVWSANVHPALPVALPTLSRLRGRHKDMTHGPCPQGSAQVEDTGNLTEQQQSPVGWRLWAWERDLFGKHPKHLCPENTTIWAVSQLFPDMHFCPEL